MENQKENQLVFVDDDGNEVLCNILFTFESEEFKKNYVLFTPVSQENNDDEDQVEVAAASYVPGEDGSVGELFAVETEEEWKMIEEVLESFDEDCCCDDCCEDGCCEDECCEDEDCHCCCHHCEEEK